MQAKPPGIGSDSVGLGGGLRLCLSIMLLGDVNEADPALITKQTSLFLSQQGRGSFTALIVKQQIDKRG